MFLYKEINNKMFYLCVFSVGVVSMGTWYHASASALLHQVRTLLNSVSITVFSCLLPASLVSAQCMQVCGVMQVSSSLLASSHDG